MNNRRYDAVVIGGGISGMEAAHSLSEMNFKVLLVEKHPQLGGKVKELACMATEKCGKCSACLVQNYFGNIANSKNIDVVTQAKVVDVKESNQQKTLSIVPVAVKNNQKISNSSNILTKEIKVDTSTIIIATGFQPFNPKDDRLLGYGHFKQVVTTKDLNDILKKDRHTELFEKDSEKIRVAFIQCVGSRDKRNGHNYCSQYCCKTSMRLVQRLKYLYPKLEICVYYIDLQIMGKEFRTYYEQTKQFTTFKQGVPVEIRVGNTENTVKLIGVNKDTGLGEEAEYDMVVLAVGIVPDARNKKLVEIFSLQLNENGFIRNNENELERRGIYLAGTCYGPADIQTSITSAKACSARVSNSISQKILLEPEVVGMGA